MASKASGNLVSNKFIQSRIEALKAKGFGKTKWIEFCEHLNSRGLKCYLYEARQTLSKYITVTDGKSSVKVRFSNHKPIKSREIAGDCDFFVGVTNTGVRTTADAIAFVEAHFE
jgi:hypothetical protein